MGKGKLKVAFVPITHTYYLGKIIMEALPKGKLSKVNGKINNGLLR